MGLFLLPWVIMFGVSTSPSTITSPEPVSWTRLAERTFDAPVPAAAENLRPLGRQMMDAARHRGRLLRLPRQSAAGASRPSGLSCAGSHQLLRRGEAARRRAAAVFAAAVPVGHAHARRLRHGRLLGLGLGACLSTLCRVGLILWIASGIYMWWGLPVDTADGDGWRSAPAPLLRRDYRDALMFQAACPAPRTTACRRPTQSDPCRASAARPRRASGDAVFVSSTR